MRTKTAKIILAIIAFLCVSACFVAPTFADDIIETTFFGNLKDDGEGCGIFTVLDLVLQILAGGVGIAAVIGISISGVMYLTAKDNEAQVTKAKSRIFNIVIGVVAFVIIYAGLVFLLPNFNPNLAGCSKVSNSELAEYQAQKEAERKEAANKNNPSSNSNSGSGNSGNSGNSGSGNSNSGSGSGSGSTKRTKKERNKEIRQKIAGIAYKLAKNGNGNSPTKAFSEAFKRTGVGAYESGNDDWCHRIGRSCGTFASTVLVDAGALSINKVSRSDLVFAYKFQAYFANSKKWKNVTRQRREPGDVGLAKYTNDWHIFIFINKKWIADGNNCNCDNGEQTCGWFGKMRRANTQFVTEVYRYVGG